MPTSTILLPTRSRGTALSFSLNLSFFSGWPEDEGYYANSIIASRLSDIPLQNLLTYVCLDFSLYLQGCSKSGPQVV